MDASGVDPSEVPGLMPLLPFKGKLPELHPSVFVAEGAMIVGDVTIGKDSSVWFNAVVRGDVHYIRIGERTNVQDNAVIHVTNRRFPTVIGSDVTIGHSAVVHACTINDYCLIGMGAVVLDDAKVGPYALVAAGAVVPMGMTVPEGVLVAGVPARIVRPLTEDERDYLRRSAQNYVGYVAEYR